MLRKKLKKNRNMKMQRGRTALAGWTVRRKRRKRKIADKEIIETSSNIKVSHSNSKKVSNNRRRISSNQRGKDNNRKDLNRASSKKVSSRNHRENKMTHRFGIFLFSLVILFASCDKSRVYEKN